MPVVILFLAGFPPPLGIGDIAPHDALHAVRADDDVCLCGGAVFEVDDVCVEAGVGVGGVGAGDEDAAFVEVGDVGVDVLDEGVEELGAVDAERVVCWFCFELELCRVCYLVRMLAC